MVVEINQGRGRKNEPAREECKRKEKPDFSSFSCGGDSWTRTNDPIDVNDVLYRLSHATMFRTLGLPVQLDIWTSSSYRLSHATLYIFYDAYATFSRTIRPRQSEGR